MSEGKLIKTNCYIFTEKEIELCGKLSTYNIVVLRQTTIPRRKFFQTNCLNKSLEMSLRAGTRKHNRI